MKKSMKTNKGIGGLKKGAKRPVKYEKYQKVQGGLVPKYKKVK
jgi:hypothetical protein